MIQFLYYLGLFIVGGLLFTWAIFKFSSTPDPYDAEDGEGGGMKLNLVELINLEWNCYNGLCFSVLYIETHKAEGAFAGI